MDSLAAPQDRLVEQLLSPRTQAQRRLKVCVCVSVCVERGWNLGHVFSLAWPRPSGYHRRWRGAPRADVHWG